MLNAALDAAGAIILLLWISWLAAGAGAWSGGKGGAIQLLAACALVFGVARVATRFAGATVPVAVVVAALAALGTAGGDVVSGGPLAKPLGYANANAAFLVQAGVAGFLLSREQTGHTWLRGSGAAAAVLFTSLALLAGSRTAAGLLFVFAPCTLVVHRLKGPRAAIAFCAVAWVLVLAATTGLASRYDEADAREGVIGYAAAALSERRLALWNETLNIAQSHPIDGVGIGEFARHSAIARGDRDAAWAHHEFLQHAAEAGIPALVLMSAVFVWGFLRLGAAAAEARHAAPVAVGWAALGAHASVDYVLHFPVVSLTACALLGVGMVSTARTRPFA